MVFADAVGLIQDAGEEVPVDAMAWGPAPPGGLAVTMFCGRWRLGGKLDTTLVPPLCMFRQPAIGGDSGELPAAEIPGTVRTLVSTLAAAWSLMDQPTIASRSEAPLNRKLVRAYRRAGRPAPAVSIIDLRTIYRANYDCATDTGRTYRHRWVVRGHWRDQAHGPSRELRKRIYVPSYIKGPDGAPLLERERVNVWRR
jgi:hypothetical protein